MLRLNIAFVVPPSQHNRPGQPTCSITTRVLPSSCHPPIVSTPCWPTVNMPERSSSSPKTLKQPFLSKPYSISSSTHLFPKDQPQDPSANPVYQEHRDNKNPRQLQYCHLIALFCHSRHTSCGPADTRAHIAEHLIGVVQCLLRPRIVVDIERDVF